MAQISALTFLPPEAVSFTISFVFVFAIVFALLVYSGVFARKDKEGHVKEKAPKGPLMAIAAVIAAATSFYGPFVVFLQSIIPLASILLIAIFFLVFLQQIVKKEGKGDPWPAMVGMAVFLLVLATVWPSVQSLFGFTGIAPDTMLWILGIVVILLIFYLAYYMPKEK